jgi:hypothetical protein
LNQRSAIWIAKEASPEGSYRREIEEAKMAWIAGIDTEKMNDPKLPPKEGKGKFARFCRTGVWSEKDLEIAEA